MRMRIFLTLIWACILFIFTCSVNFHMLIKYQFIDFQINPAPDWLELLKSDYQWSDTEWLQRKAGHMLGFFILALLGSKFGKYSVRFLSLGSLCCCNRNFAVVFFSRRTNL